MIYLTEILQGLEIKLAHQLRDLPIKGVAYDSRKVVPQSLFVALRGYKTDGHRFVASAIEKGATAVVCESIPDEIAEGDASFIVVENSRKALARISHNYFNEPSLVMKTIGVTGTNGKTTTAYILRSIFDAANQKTGVIGTIGALYGREFRATGHTTPESLELAEILSEMKAAGTEVVAAEVSSHALDQSRTDYLDFDAACFTNLTLDHLDYHENPQNYARAKKKLFDGLKSSAVAVAVNGSEYSEYILSDTRARKIFVGRTNDSEVKILNEKSNLRSISFKLDYFGEEIEFRSGLLGAFNVDNCALAATTALALGVEREAVVRGVAETSGAPGRMQKVNLKSGAVALVDYAHTPDALEKALAICRKALNESKEDAKLLVVFGCGGDRDKSKRPIMGEIASRIADAVLITDDNPRTENPIKIIEEIIAGAEKTGKNNFTVVSDRAEAIGKACSFAKKGDLVLVAGKGHESHQIVGEEILRFDDFEEVLKYS